MENKFLCPKCGYTQDKKVETCPECGVVIKKLSNPSKRTHDIKKHLEKKKNRGRNRLILAVLVLPIIIFYFIGSVHIVTGSSYDGSLIVEKTTFGFSETFINTDQIIGMPIISAKTRFPLSVKVLQRTGHIETDDERRERSRKEFKQIQVGIERKVNREIDKSIVEMEDLIRSYE